MPTEIPEMENITFKVAVEEPQYEVNECAYWSYWSNWCELQGKRCRYIDREKCRAFEPVPIEG